MNKNKFERGNEMRKKDRHRLITRILNDFNIEKQEDFVDILRKQGVEVTQATISRDIKELNLLKVPNGKGGYFYSLPKESEQEIQQRIMRLLKNGCISIEMMDKMIMIKTLPGNAAALASLLEKYYKNQLFGLLNDDDGILLIVRSQADGLKIYQKLETYK